MNTFYRDPCVLQSVRNRIEWPFLSLDKCSNNVLVVTNMKLNSKNGDTRRRVQQMKVLATTEKGHFILVPGLPPVGLLVDILLFYLN